MKCFIIELGIWNQVSYDLRSYERNLNNCEEAWKSQDLNGVWARDPAIPVRRSNQLNYEATDVGNRSFKSSNEPVRNECEVIYEMFSYTSHRYREVTGSNHVEVLTFSGLYTQFLNLRS